jgi:ergothioneine biosynthesis protein EgtB
MLERFVKTRSRFELLCKPLLIEDYSVQPSEFASPPKWHLAHVTWFWEEFILTKHYRGYKVYDDDFYYLFNSYYNNVGKRVLRPTRGLMTRPSVEEVFNYRNHVTNAMVDFLKTSSSKEVMNLVEIGINHEEQHQELFLYDIKYILGNQPTFPEYGEGFKLNKIIPKSEFLSIESGIYEIGHDGNAFSFDNELGRHKVFLNDFEISNRLVTNGEYLEFMNAGGYQDFNFWHDEGWNWINTEKICAPMYWHLIDEEWHYYDLNGLQKVDLNQPVKHIGFFEAFAFAEWKEMRLPTEFEWEIASDKFNWGQLWEWTNSAYLPYPGFNKAPGALGEYNGKFMVNQMVLRGGSIVTPPSHSRKTYRNFFQTNMRWQYNGIRLAK